ncbi:MAG: hypothetical protein JNK37_13425 [Verrucomicrobiales bacterium]|nr:hypothetical protein [Verrucomicrobiales bacterium]
MKHLLLPTTRRTDDRELHTIRRGLLGGCEVYLSKKERFPVRSGFYQRELRRHFPHLAADAHLFVDIGAGEGFLSAYMLRHTAAKVVAFERDPRLSGILLRNLACNTAESHRVGFYGDTNPADIALDRLTTGERGPVLIKIQAPGAERKILEGAGRLLDREDTRVVARLTDRESEARCMHLLDEYGFNVSLVTPAWWRPVVRDHSFDVDSVWLVAEKPRFEVLPD